MLFLQVGNLAAPVEEWTVSGTALTSLMDVERRHGNIKRYDCEIFDKIVFVSNMIFVCCRQIQACYQESYG